MGEKSYLLKNPIVQNKLNISFTNPAGNIIEEIDELEMTDKVGGVTPTVVISWVGTVLTSMSVSSVAVVSASATNPGRVCTISAECTRDYKRCD